MNKIIKVAANKIIAVLVTIVFTWNQIAFAGETVSVPLDALKQETVPGQTPETFREEAIQQASDVSRKQEIEYFQSRVEAGERAEEESETESALEEVLTFDGIDDYVKVQDAEGLDIGFSDYTISAWIKVDNPARFGTIVNKNGHHSIGASYHLGIDDYGKIYFAISDGDTEVNTYKLAGRT
ncbi:MAG: LamG-like jellyroll fold domain-containing protein, partial [Candidatus Omnitrophota bacterium]